MELEKLNKEYVEFKSDLADHRAEVENLDRTAGDLADDKIIWKAKLVEAKRNKDTVAEQQANSEIKRIDGELKKTLDDSSKKKDEMKDLQAKIDSRIKDIKENPNMKKHFDEVLSKKLDRNLSKIEKEKEEYVKKKERFSNLNQLVTDHPALKNNLKGYMGATKDIKALQKELDGLKMVAGTGNTSAFAYSDPVRANEILYNLLPQAQSKLETNKTSLMNYISNKGLNITEQEIVEFSENDLVIRKDKNNGVEKIDFEATIKNGFSKINSQIDRKIKGYDKSIKNHEIALENYGGRRRPATPDSQADSEAVAVKPKWYQFIQRFRNWNQRRKQRALPEPVSEPSNSKKKDEFSDSLKFEIVQDAVEKMQQENLKDAKTKAKQNERDER